uniref:Thioredoxin domain-containing protein n=1 Tax=Hucho hucho TaxID=62062 RepID=A0A4W5Q650_9TELE
DVRRALAGPASEVDQAALVDVQALTTDDVRGSKLALLVMFHAPWCGHCNKLLPTFGKVATALKAKNMLAGSIDGTNVANRPLMQAFRIASYPTILMLHDTSYTLFEGDRSVDALVAFADGGYKTTTSTKKDMPVIPKKEDAPTEMAKNVHVAEWTTTIFDTVLQGPANSSVSSSELFLVEFYAQWCGPCRAFAAAYEAIAEDLKSDMVVARIDGALEEELRTRLNVESYPSVLLVDKTKRLVYAFPSKNERTKDAVLDFVKGGYKATTPTQEAKDIPTSPLVDQAALVDVQTLTTDDVRGSKLARLVMFHAPWCGHCNKLLPTFGKVATALKAKNIIAGSIDGTNVANRPLMQAFRVASYPTILMLHDDSYTLFEGDRSVDALVAFADGGYTTTSTKKDMPVIPTAEAIQPEQLQATRDLSLVSTCYCSRLFPLPRVYDFDERSKGTRPQRRRAMCWDTHVAPACAPSRCQ